MIVSREGSVFDLPIHFMEYVGPVNDSDIYVMLRESVRKDVVPDVVPDVAPGPQQCLEPLQ